MKPLSLFAFIILLPCFTLISAPTIYIAPPGGYEHEKLFDLTDKRLNEENRSLPFYNLREALRTVGYDLKTTTFAEPLTDFAGLIVCNIPPYHVLHRAVSNRQDKCIQLLFEPPALAGYYYDPFLKHYFSKIFTLWADQVDNNQYIRFFYPQVSLEMTHEQIPFNERTLCTLIASNKSVQHPQEIYSQRLAAIEFFEHYAPHDFDFYGHNWSAQQHPCYKGEIESKIQVLTRYKFCICYENSRFNGYITEKIFDCFIAGCVPVYCGAPDICSYIPAACFIDRDQFNSMEELYTSMVTMSEAEYNRYIQAIHSYLQSAQAMLFSQEYFIHTILSFFVPDYNMAEIFSLPQEQALKTATCKQFYPQS